MRRCQLDNYELKKDRGMQGAKRKTGKDLHSHKFWLATANKLHVILAIEKCSPYVRCLHSVLRPESRQKGKLVATEGVRDGNEAPGFVVVKNSHWDGSR